MTHLNMTVEIDVCADDEWGSSRAWVEHQVMNKVAGAVSDLFKYPISSKAELQELHIDGDEIHCNCSGEEIAKSFIDDVKAVKDLLPR